MNWEWVDKHHPEDRELYEWRYMLAKEEAFQSRMKSLIHKMAIANGYSRRLNLRRRMDRLTLEMKRLESKKLAWKLAHG